MWYACGTPWSGKYDISRPACVPLAGIAFLNRDTTNHIEPYKGIKAVHELLNQTVRPQSAAKKMELLELVGRLVTEIPVWKLFCNMDLSAVDVSFGAMSGEVKE